MHSDVDERETAAGVGCSGNKSELPCAQGTHRRILPCLSEDNDIEIPAEANLRVLRMKES